MLKACKRNHYGSYELPLSLGYDGLSKLPDGQPPLTFGIEQKKIKSDQSEPSDFDRIYTEVVVCGNEDEDVEEVKTSLVGMCIGDISDDHMAYWNKEGIENQDEAIELGEKLAAYLNDKDLMSAILFCVHNKFEYGSN